MKHGSYQNHVILSMVHELGHEGTPAPTRNSTGFTELDFSYDRGARPAPGRGFFCVSDT